METTITSCSLGKAMKTEDIVPHLYRLRHERGWFSKLMQQQFYAPVADHTLVLVCNVGGQPAGVMMIDASKQCGVFVDPAQRRRGIGTILIQRAHELVATGMKCIPDDDGGYRFFKSHELSLHLEISWSECCT